jgi:hypothetical protein
MTPGRTERTRATGLACMGVGVILELAGFVGAWISRPAHTVFTDPLYDLVMLAGIVLLFIGFRLRNGHWPGSSSNDLAA